MSEQVISGRLLRITFYNPDNGYAVVRVQVPGQREPLTAVGKLPGAIEGQRVRMTGKETRHPKFGPQFEIERAELLPPDDSEGINRYLASGLIKGIGPKLAKRLVEALGDKALEIIQEQPERLASVPGIGPQKAASIANSVRSHGELRAVMVFLQGHGVGVGTSLRIWQEYGLQTLELLRKEPHRLAQDVRGIGFATADRIAQRLGLPLDHPSRLEAGLTHSLSQALEEGHTYLPQEELLDQAVRLLGLERLPLGPALERLLQTDRVVRVEAPEGTLIYLTFMLNLEERAGRALVRASRNPGLLPGERAEKAVEWVQGRLALRPSPSQVAALLKLLTSGLAVLTGGPGTGKTTLVNALLTIALRMGQEVVLAAPTGRAAKRLAESCGQPALTLHRLLEYSPRTHSFQRHAQRPISADLLVVDETSMVDTWLITHLLEALSPRTKLILVGDVNQLPSVNAGLVLDQIINSGIASVACLTEIFRQAASSLIISNAHRILQGQLPQSGDPDNPQSDFFLIEQNDPLQAAQLIRLLVSERLPRQFHFDPRQDIQVLTPMRRGYLGCRHLNDLLRQALNPKASGQMLAPGDKVMQMRNNYDLEVFNGDIGVVEKSDAEGVLVNLGDRSARYSLPETEDLTLAYAVTVHKSQGSEYPAVILALAKEHFVLLNRALLYTAVTRGRRLVIIVGDRAALRRATEQAEKEKRYARLDGNILKFASREKSGGQGDHLVRQQEEGMDLNGSISMIGAGGDLTP